jgi:hypothetical protein
MAKSINNPFAIQPVPNRQRWMAAIRAVGVLLLLSLGLILAQTGARQWLLEHWAEGFGELASEQQIARLSQLDTLGDVAIPVIAKRLSAENESVALAAFELLAKRQSEWTGRSDDSMAQAHSELMVGLADIVDQLPTARLAWLNQLLNQTLVECVDQQSEPVRIAYQQANELGAMLAARARPATAPTNHVRPMVVRAPSLAPLPVSLQSDPADRPAFREASVPETDDSPALPLPTWNTLSVIGLLSGNRTAERDQATAELERRGLTPEEIRIANQLAAPQVDVRLGLLESIRSRTDIDPRPWLLWLVEDVDREVRSRAVDALAGLNDDAVRTTLRKRLVTEADVEISERIRSLIDRTRLADVGLLR